MQLNKYRSQPNCSIFTGGSPTVVSGTIHNAASTKSQDDSKDLDASAMPGANLVAFWLLGLCNNFAYVIMLSAAKDILEKGGGEHEEGHCNTTITHRDCAPLSTGSVLLADIVPSLLIKLIAPFALHSLPFDIRHFVVVSLQAASFILVAVSESAGMALSGVVLASLGSGLGEVSYLSLSSHFPAEVVTAWSSGTGGAGVFGAFAYAALTDASMAALSPKQALLAMLVVPVIFVYSFWWLLRSPRSVHRVKILDPRTYVVRRSSTPAASHRDEEEEEEGSDDRPLIDGEEGREGGHFDFSSLSPSEKMGVVRPLFAYMLPLVVVYFAEYFINQGLLELIVFDCSHGFGLAPTAQYRWFQVLYQIGVFISRTLGGMVGWLPPVAVLAGLQLVNASFLTGASLFPWLLPHLAVAAVVVLYEGLLGGSAYVHTFRSMHLKVPADRREFALGFVSISDTAGILAAGVGAIPTHNAICAMPLY